MLSNTARLRGNEINTRKHCKQKKNVSIFYMDIMIANICFAFLFSWHTYPEETNQFKWKLNWIHKKSKLNKRADQLASIK